MLRRNWIVTLLVLTLVLSITTVAFAGNEWKGKGLPPGQAKKWQLFCDENDAPWAMKYMATMKAKGILKGYEDGSFRPNSSISQTEAIVMVIRMKGTETEQDAVALANDPVPVKGAQSVWWAAGHINYALENDWIDADDFQPTAAAKRAWVAKLMVRALVEDWEDEIEKDEYQEVDFKDAKDFEDEDVPYVAIANDKGWMLGYPDGKFMPNKPVTRAEMAALLDRGEGIIPGSNSLEAKGTVTEIDEDDRELTVKKGSDAARTIKVSEDALVFIANATADFEDIEVGDEVKMVLNTAGVALVVTVESRDNEISDDTVDGTISDLDLDDEPMTLTLSTKSSTGATVTTEYELDDDCKAYYDGERVSLSSLDEGDEVELTLDEDDDDVVIKITVTEKADEDEDTVEGTISDLDLDDDPMTITLTKTSSSGSTTSTEYELDDDCKAYYDGERVSLSSLDEGDEVELTLDEDDDDVVTKITVTEKADDDEGVQITGTITAIATSSSTTTLTVKDSNNVEFTYPLVTNAVLKSGSVTITVSQLTTGLRVTITVVDSAITTLQVVSQ